MKSPISVCLVKSDARQVWQTDRRISHWFKVDFHFFARRYENTPLIMTIVMNFRWRMQSLKDVIASVSGTHYKQLEEVSFGFSLDDVGLLI
jgi:hypothetical protein